VNGPLQCAWISRIALAAGLALAGGWAGRRAMQADAGQGAAATSRGHAEEGAAHVASAGEGEPTVTVVFVRPEPAKIRTPARIADGKYIDIDLAAQIMSLFQDGRLVDTYAISSGKSGMETPKGTHTVINKSGRAWSRKYGVFLPYWMAFTPGGSFGIHEVPEWPDGDKEGAGELGLPVSHGCVRLGSGAAERVYAWAEIGTPVVVY